MQSKQSLLRNVNAYADFMFKVRSGAFLKFFILLPMKA